MCNGKPGTAEVSQLNTKGPMKTPLQFKMMTLQKLCLFFIIIEANRVVVHDQEIWTVTVFTVTVDVVALHDCKQMWRQRGKVALCSHMKNHRKHDDTQD